MFLVGQNWPILQYVLQADRNMKNDKTYEGKYKIGLLNGNTHDSLQLRLSFVRTHSSGRFNEEEPYRLVYILTISGTIEGAAR